MKKCTLADFGKTREDRVWSLDGAVAIEAEHSRDSAASHERKIDIVDAGERAVYLADRLEEAETITRLEWTDETWLLYTFELDPSPWAHSAVYRLTFRGSQRIIILGLHDDEVSDWEGLSCRYLIPSGDHYCCTMSDITDYAHDLLQSGEVGHIVYFYEGVGHWYRSILDDKRPDGKIAEGVRVIRSYQLDLLTDHIQRATSLRDWENWVSSSDESDEEG